MSSHIGRLSVIALTMLCLSGCIAAAIPLAAGGALLGKDRIGGDKDSAVLDAPIAAADPTSVKEEPKEQAGVAEGAVKPPQRPEFADEQPHSSPMETKELAAILSGGTDPTSTPEAAPTVALSSRAYNAMRGYVDREVSRDTSEQPIRSAVLAAPTSLLPRRADCSIRPPAILIDLDPAGSTFETERMKQAEPELVAMLQALRQQEIEIFWVANLPALKAGAVRKNLVASQLDEDADDGILLIQRAGDRKQQRRTELQETHCLIAIAGDERSDFDELYDYLKTPELAQPLEELIGAGWFLAPPPLTQGR